MRLKSYLTERSDNIKDNVNEINNILDMLKKDCKPFLNEYKRNKSMGFLYRGTNKPVGLIQKVTSRLENRYPKDTPNELHDDLNFQFKRKFGWPVRNGIFTVGRTTTAGGYGKAYIFFPIGKYSFVYSTSVPDLYTEFENENMLSDFDSYDVENEWYEYYGEDAEYGHWEYDGEEVDSNYMQDIIIELDLVPNEYRENLLNWIPDIDLDVFVSNKEEEYENDRSSMIEGIVNSYSNHGLAKAIESDNEVSFNCKSYYLINQNLILALGEMIEEL